MSWHNIIPIGVIIMESNERLAFKLCGFPSEINAGTMRSDTWLDL
jgi:hypothetical protein